VGAVRAVEARKPRLLPVRDAPEERLVGLLQPGEHVLQPMAVEGGIVWHVRTQRLPLRFLLIAREGDAALFVQTDALLQGRVGEGATMPQDECPRTRSSSRSCAGVGRSCS
jgi:hypothetical protein